MALTEQQAQYITLVRVLEQSSANGSVWSAEDAKEATRATIEVLGPKASFTDFVAKRSQWALEKINKRSLDRPLQLREPRWPLFAVQVFACLALISGFMSDLLATSFLHPGHINVIVLPLLVLVAWNLVFMAFFLFQWIWNLFTRELKPPGPLLDTLSNWRASESLRFNGKKRALWIENYKQAWSQASVAINMARLKAATNLLSLLFTVGAVSHLLFRAAFDHYTVGWKTSLTHTIDANTVHAIISWVLAPGSYVFSTPIPSAEHIATLRMPPSLGEVAETWIWLYVGSILVWVLIPRLYLVVLNAFTCWRLRRNFKLPMQATYFTTLRAAWRGQRIGVSVVPFRYELTPALRANLEAMLKRIYGLAVDITIDNPVLMGDNFSDWRNPIKREGHVAVMVIFNLSATAERDTHAVLLHKLRTAIEHGTPIVPIVDTGAYRQDAPERFRQRCKQWRQCLDAVAFTPLFLDLHKANEGDLKLLDDKLNNDD